MYTYSRINDFKGLCPFLLSPKADTLYKTHKKPSSFNPFEVSTDSEDKILCLSPSAVQRFIWNNSTLTQET